MPLNSSHGLATVYDLRLRRAGTGKVRPREGQAGVFAAVQTERQGGFGLRLVETALHQQQTSQSPVGLVPVASGGDGRAKRRLDRRGIFAGGGQSRESIPAVLPLL